MDEMAGALRRFSHVDLHRQGYGWHESRRRACHASGWYATGESKAGSWRCLCVLRRCRAHETRLRGADARPFQLDSIGSRSRTGTRGGSWEDHQRRDALRRPYFSQRYTVRGKGSEESRCHVHPVWWEGNTVQGIRSLGTMLNFIYDRAYKYFATRYFHLKLLGSLLKNELSINCENPFIKRDSKVLYCINRRQMRNILFNLISFYSNILFNYTERFSASDTENTVYHFILVGCKQGWNDSLCYTVSSGLFAEKRPYSYFFFFYLYICMCNTHVIIFYILSRQDNKQTRERRILNRIVASIYGGYRELKLD